MEFIFFEEEPLQHPLQNKNIAFTGALSTMTRSEAARRVKVYNATLQGAVKTDTDFLVLGNKRRGVSTKQLQAEKYIALGYDIQIIYEDDFLWLLSQ